MPPPPGNFSVASIIVFSVRERAEFNESSNLKWFLEREEFSNTDRYGKVQNMDPWSMDPLRGPGPWTGSIKIWTRSMDPFHGPGPWTPYFYYP